MEGTYSSRTLGKFTEKLLRNPVAFSRPPPGISLGVSGLLLNSSFHNKRNQDPGRRLPASLIIHSHQATTTTLSSLHMAAQPKSDLVLLDVFGSPFAQRVRIALAEKDLAYECAEQDIFAKSDLLLRSNPVHKKVPVLLHAGRGPVCESLTILQYLDDAFPEGRLLPTDPYARARARFWAEFSDRAHSCGKRLWMMARDGGGQTEEEEEEARAEMLRVLGALDAELGDKEFFGGGDGEEFFGYVDVAVAPFAAWFAVYERYGGFSVAGECPRLAAWAARCVARESVAANVYAPDKMCELVELYKQRVLAGQQQQQTT